MNKMLTFKTNSMIFHVVAGKVTLARCAKTGRFVKLIKASKVLNSLKCISKKYLERMENCSFVAGGFKKSKDFIDNALSFLSVTNDVVVTNLEDCTVLVVSTRYAIMRILDEEC